MEILFLLGSILSTTVTSVVLSLLLPFRHLLRRVSVGCASDDPGNFVALYEGTVWHERRRPVHHAFRYSVRYALIDLDNAPHAPPDNLSADEARRIANTNGQVYRSDLPSSYSCYGF